MSELLFVIGIGWASGISPGPLTTLVVTTALNRGFAAGARVAIAPLITDVPIIAVSLLLVAAVPDRLITSLAVVGGGYLIWLGVLELRAADIEDQPISAGADVRRGALTNVLSPHPWLFWFTVGAPTTVTAWARSESAALAFVAGFYVLLVGTKISLAWIATRAGRRLDVRHRVLLSRLGAGLLLVFGLVLIVGGL